MLSEMGVIRRSERVRADISPMVKTAVRLGVGEGVARAGQVGVGWPEESRTP